MPSLASFVSNGFFLVPVHSHSYAKSYFSYAKSHSFDFLFNYFYL